MWSTCILVSGDVYEVINVEDHAAHCWMAQVIDVHGGLAIPKQHYY